MFCASMHALGLDKAEINTSPLRIVYRCLFLVSFLRHAQAVPQSPAALFQRHTLPRLRFPTCWISHGFFYIRRVMRKRNM